MSKDSFSERFSIKYNIGPNKGMEKISVNMNPSVLSSIDLLVDNGYYSNRSDFINQAVREALGKQQTTIDRIVEQNMNSAAEGNQWFIGLFGYTANEIAQMYVNGEQTDVRGYGVMTISGDCDEEKLFAVVRSIEVRGKVICSDSIKAHYGLK